MARVLFNTAPVKHGMIWKAGRLVKCSGRLKTKASGLACDCGARMECY